MPREHTEQTPRRHDVAEPPVYEERPAPYPERAATMERVDSVAADPYAERRYAADRAVQAVYLVFGVIEGLIAIRFVLKLLGANPRAGFSSFIYNVTDPLLAPFAGMFGTPTARNGSVLEIHTIVAFIVYALLAWLVVKLVWLLLGDTRRGLVSSTHTVDHEVHDPYLR